MAGAKFEYDEQGSTFYYFFISFYAMVLIPATYYFWPRKSKKEITDKTKCHCEGCVLKEEQKKQNEPWRNFKRRATAVILVLLWIGFVFSAYKIAQIEIEHHEYDPYAILGLDSGASDQEIRKAYRKLSKLHHPDRGGDPKRFVEMAKAYEALTNEEVRENWEKYGNPDGPGAMRFGIALPSWIVEKENSMLVLAVYVLAFMIILPTAVGVWWYKSIRYSAEQVLLTTSQMYLHFIMKTPNLILKRALTILSGSFEFDPRTNKEVATRPSDNQEIPTLMKDLPNLNETKRDPFFSSPFSLKSRVLLHAHLSRIPLPPATLELDRVYIVNRCPVLIQEMVSCFSNLVALAAAGRIPRMPSLEALDHIMKLSPMVVQALWDKKSPLLQLPHITEEMLRFCVTKKRSIRTCANLASMVEDDRRSLLRSLGPQEYLDVLNVLNTMPTISLDIRVEVEDDEDKETITAGALVTVYVTMTRRPLSHFKPALENGSGDELSGDMMAANGDILDGGDENSTVLDDDDVPDVDDMDNEGNLDDGEAGGDGESSQPKKKVWEKNKKKKGGKAKKKPAAKKGPPAKGKGAVASTTQQKEGAGDEEKKEEEDVTKDSVAKEGTKGGKKGKGKKRNQPAEEDFDSDDDGSIISEGSDFSGAESLIDEVEREKVDRDIAEAEAEDMLFEDQLTRKQRILESKTKVTHPVHCPYFPTEKYEWWWLFLVDRKRKMLVTSPSHVTTLVDSEEVQLKFQAPPVKGQYIYALCLRSDSYLDCDQTKEIKLTVHEARQITSHPQWDFPSDEEAKGSEGADSDDLSDYTEGEYSSNED